MQGTRRLLQNCVTHFRRAKRTSVRPTTPYKLPIPAAGQSITARATRVTPEPVKPSSEAAARDTSITRPRMKGPRSLMRTTTVRPLRRFVTRTLVPNGNERCAAVMAEGLKRSPLAVLRPCQ